MAITPEEKKRALDYWKLIQSQGKGIPDFVYGLMSAGFGPGSIRDVLDMIMPSRIPEERNEGIAGYAIWFSDGISDYPAAGRFDVKEIYESPLQAEHDARLVSLRYPKLQFSVYPVNSDWDIVGERVATYGSNAGFNLP